MIHALVVAASLLALDDAPRAATLLEPTESKLSQLNAEYGALFAQRPSLTGPAISAGVGAGLIVGGGLSFALGFALRASLFFVFMIIGPAIAGVGLITGVIGSWLLIARLPERRRVDAELRRLKAEIAEEQRRRPPPAIFPSVGF